MHAAVTAQAFVKHFTDAGFEARFQSALEAFAAFDLADEEPAILSGDLVDLVVAYADRVEDRGLGKVCLSLSRERLRDAEVRAALGTRSAAAAEVQVLWDEREGQVLKVWGLTETAAAPLRAAPKVRRAPRLHAVA